jgi:hypothetical protein
MRATLRAALTVVAAATALTIGACSASETTPTAHSVGAGSPQPGAGTAAATPSTATSATATPGTTSSAAPTKPSTSPPGTAYFLVVTATSVQIKVLRSGRLTVAASLTRDADYCVWNSASVAPDGTHIAWIEPTGELGAIGSLRVADINGSHPRTLATNVICADPKATSWDGSSRVVVRTRTKLFTINISSGKRTTLSGLVDVEVHVAYSADGRTIVRQIGDTVTVGPVGGHSTTLHYTPPAAEAARWNGWQTYSVARDGRMISVNWNGTDPQRRDNTFAVVRVSDGATVALPHADVNHVEFLANGNVFALRGRVYDVLDSHLRVLTTSTLPSSLTTFRPLRYVP